MTGIGQKDTGADFKELSLARPRVIQTSKQIMIGIDCNPFNKIGLHQSTWIKVYKNLGRKKALSYSRMPTHKCRRDIAVKKLEFFVSPLTISVFRNCFRIKRKRKKKCSVSTDGLRYFCQLISPLCLSFFICNTKIITNI